MIFWVHGRINGQKTVQNDKKLCLLSNKKLSGNIIILHMCNINGNHMIIYGSWAMEHDRQIFLSFWITFCPVKQHLKSISKIIKSRSTTLHIKMTQHYHKNIGKSKSAVEHQKSHGRLSQYVVLTIETVSAAFYV